MMLALSALVRPHPLNSIRLNSSSGATQATGPAPPRQQPAASFAPLSLTLRVEVRRERQQSTKFPRPADRGTLQASWYHRASHPVYGQSKP